MSRRKVTARRRCTWCKLNLPLAQFAGARDDVCKKCSAEIQAEAAAEMGVEDYYAVTGDLPGD